MKPCLKEAQGSWSTLSRSEKIAVEKTHIYTKQNFRRYDSLYNNPSYRRPLSLEVGRSMGA
jgi:hypothetical protein